MMEHFTVIDEPGYCTLVTSRYWQQPTSRM